MDGEWHEEQACVEGGGRWAEGQQWLHCCPGCPWQTQVLSVNQQISPCLTPEMGFGKGFQSPCEMFGTFAHLTFMECLLCTRLCSRPYGYTAMEDQKLLLCQFTFMGGGTHIRDKITGKQLILGCTGMGSPAERQGRGSRSRVI